VSVTPLGFAVVFVANILIWQNKKISKVCAKLICSDLLLSKQNKQAKQKRREENKQFPKLLTQMRLWKGR
jgi:hypothetical protein